MEYDTRAFFTEREATDVQGFVIIETDATEGYRIAEKWQPADRDATWLTYWIPEASLLDRVESGDCEQTTTVSETQLEGVLNLAGVADQIVEADAAVA